MNDANPIMQQQVTSLDFSFTCHHGDQHEYMPEVRRLREKCWPDLYSAGYSLDDEFDAEAFHWIVTLEEQLVASARLSMHLESDHIPETCLRIDEFNQLSKPVGFLNRLVVHPQWRGHGLGAQLDKLRLTKAAEEGCKTMCVVWATGSEDHRRKQILQTGFRSPDGGLPREDGAFGTSLVYFLDLKMWSDSNTNSQRSNFN
jgi:GNAT superfamily N-acetyltransferase